MRPKVTKLALKLLKENDQRWAGEWVAMYREVRDHTTDLHISLRWLKLERVFQKQTNPRGRLWERSLQDHFQQPLYIAMWPGI